jgi:glycosyltransferase involved in cell wall biosynthesis
MTENSVSVCIPCYSMRGKGQEFLNTLLHSIEMQSYKNFEVVISDHSEDEKVLEVCKLYDTKFKISYIKNDYKRGNSSANVNVAISNANHKLIKVMFQDDFFVNENALKEISTLPDGWAATPFIHTDENASSFFRPFLPLFHDKIALGQNTLGCPSVIHFFKDVQTRFDENTIWLMDCDFYQQLYNKYGSPRILKQINLAVRIWGDSVSGHVTEEVKSNEFRYIKEKYGF